MPSTLVIVLTDDNECTISASVAQFWKGFNIYRAAIFTLHIYNVNFLNNIAVNFMVHLQGILIVIIKCVYLGERPEEKCGMYLLLPNVKL